VDALRPDGGGIYQIIFRYRSRAEHEAWMSSDRPGELVAQIDKLLGDGATAEVPAVDGWEGWFVTPGYAPPPQPDGGRWLWSRSLRCIPSR
jgi:antibiotic biosynthesis monooxygenase (ABM) superfamily enzyme